MANHPSAEKRNRQRLKRTLRNRSAKSAVRTLVKQVRGVITSAKAEGADVLLRNAISALDRAATKGAIHPKAAARTIGRLSAAIHKLSKKA